MEIESLFFYSYVLLVFKASLTFRFLSINLQKNCLFSLKFLMLWRIQKIYSQRGKQKKTVEDRKSIKFLQKFSIWTNQLRRSLFCRHESTWTIWCPWKLRHLCSRCNYVHCTSACSNVPWRYKFSCNWPYSLLVFFVFGRVHKKPFEIQEKM